MGSTTTRPRGEFRRRSGQCLVALRPATLAFASPSCGVSRVGGNAAAGRPSRRWALDGLGRQPVSGPAGVVRLSRTHSGRFHGIHQPPLVYGDDQWPSSEILWSSARSAIGQYSAQPANGRTTVDQPLHFFERVAEFLFADRVD